MLAEALTAYGIKDIFSSPGTRNAPLILALARNGCFNIRPVVDERSAAFIALGFASVARTPVALVCTSGTALLNYAPAVAEAFYRKIPLVVISADRPAEWIGQDDSQTLPQPGALGHIVRRTVNLRGEIDNDRDRWLVNRSLNEVLQVALNGRPGPVHINISFDEPLTADGFLDTGGGFRKVDLITPASKIDTESARQLAAEASEHSVLIVGGFTPPSAYLNRAIGKLANLPGVVVMADALANINSPDVLSRPDLILDDAALSSDAGRPSLLITFGGSLLSRKLKEYLRATEFADHWHVGLNESLIDSYFSLTRRIEIAEEMFFPRFANAMEYLARKACTSISGYKEIWRDAKLRAESTLRKPATTDRWSARTAVHTLLATLPADWNLQLSNGLTPRYAVTGDAVRFHRRDCNRGVSGIDGSVSTALGASLAYRNTTLLITGDMSLQYDMAALSSTLLTPKLKIVVINNRGGGIFRKISATCHLPEREHYFICELNVHVKELSRAYGLDYYSADSTDSLHEVLTRFAESNDRPAILELFCPPHTNE